MSISSMFFVQKSFRQLFSSYVLAKKSTFVQKRELKMLMKLTQGRKKYCLQFYKFAARQTNVHCKDGLHKCWEEVVEDSEWEMLKQRGGGGGQERMSTETGQRVNMRTCPPFILLRKLTAQLGKQEKSVINTSSS